MLSRRAALVLLATGCLAPAPVAAQRDKPVHLGILSMTSAFELVINAKAAEALGVKLHPAAVDPRRHRAPLTGEASAWTSS